MSKQVRKPLKWVGSAKRDLDAMPEDVKDLFGHARLRAAKLDFEAWQKKQGAR
jgi:phage-related protein